MEKMIKTQVLEKCGLPWEEEKEELRAAVLSINISDDFKENEDRKFILIKMTMVPLYDAKNPWTNEYILYCVGSEKAHNNLARTFISFAPEERQKHFAENKTIGIKLPDGRTPYIEIKGGGLIKKIDGKYSILLGSGSYGNAEIGIMEVFASNFEEIILSKQFLRIKKEKGL